MLVNTIPLDAVRSALLCAVVKRKTAGRELGGQPHARVAAFTYHAPLTSVSCCGSRVGQARRHFPGSHFGVLTCGDLDHLIKRVCLEHVHREVRRTWGAGLRALQAGLGNGVLR